MSFFSRYRHHPDLHSFPTRRSSDLLSRQMTTSTTSIDIMGLQAAYANLHTDQERDYFMQRYHDVNRCGRSRRSEERFSRNAETDIVCRLLLEKKKRLSF